MPHLYETPSRQFANHPRESIRKQMTKKEAREHKVNWNRALAEGRVVRYNGGNSFRSFPTVEEANDFIKKLAADDGMVGTIVKPRLG